MPPKNPKYKRRANRYGRKKVSSHPRQIQSATYLPKNRLVRFSDFRTYIVTDDAIGAPGSGHAGANFPSLQIGANMPNMFEVNTTGTWTKTSLNKKGAAVPGVPLWVTRPDGSSESGVAPYKNAQCISSKITVSAFPIVDYSDDAATEQDCVKLVLHKSTTPDVFHNKVISDDINAETASQLPLVKTANIYVNRNGTPRGATIRDTYRYKAMNAGIASMANNYFHADNADGSKNGPAEKDFWSISLIGQDSANYGLSSTGGVRLGRIRVQVKIDYIVLLSEPNNSQFGAFINEGEDLSSAAHINTQLMALKKYFETPGTIVDV